VSKVKEILLNRLHVRESKRVFGKGELNAATIDSKKGNTGMEGGRRNTKMKGTYERGLIKSIHSKRFFLTDPTCEGPCTIYATWHALVALANDTWAIRLSSVREL